jgi:hypothetical protein
MFSGDTGSKLMLGTNAGEIYFTIDKAFDSEILPDRDYVKRSESVERTWSWMSMGTIELRSGPQIINLKLLDLKNKEAGL